MSNCDHHKKKGKQKELDFEDFEPMQEILGLSVEPSIIFKSNGDLEFKIHKYLLGLERIDSVKMRYDKSWKRCIKVQGLETKVIDRIGNSYACLNLVDEMANYTDVEKIPELEDYFIKKCKLEGDILKVTVGKKEEIDAGELRLWGEELE